MHANELVARNLRRLRIARGAAQEVVAVDAGIDRTYVSRLERKMENPTVAVLERLANALEVTIDQFFAPIDPDAAEPQTLRSGRKAKLR